MASLAYLDIVYIFVVAFLWGGTNPFLKRASKGMERIKHKSWILQLMAELQFLLKNWNYTIPLILNQSGSIFYNLLIARLDLSLAVPVVNALTFFMTILIGIVLHEPITKTKIIGSVLILTGVSFCIVDKL